MLFYNTYILSIYSSSKIDNYKRNIEENGTSNGIVFCTLVCFSKNITDRPDKLVWWYNHGLVISRLVQLAVCD